VPEGVVEEAQEDLLDARGSEEEIRRVGRGSGLAMADPVGGALGTAYGGRVRCRPQFRPQPLQVGLKGVSTALTASLLHCFLKNADQTDKICQYVAILTALEG